MSALYDEKRTLLPWTTFGFVMEKFYLKGYITKKELSAGGWPHMVEAENKFDELVMSVIPRFVARVKEIENDLEQTHTQVTEMKTRLLAFGATALLAGFQFLAFLLTKHLGLDKIEKALEM
jgi:hypothetical protein